mgnify:CR=1 FL=1
MNQARQKTPIHLWVVGILAILWNLGGAFDYMATQLRIESYMSQFTQQQLEYFYGFPAWMDAAWAIAVWASLLGAIALLLRKSWAVGLFGAAIAGLFVSTMYNFVLMNGAEVMGDFAVKFTIAIWIIAVLLLVYARAMDKKGVLI